MPYRADPELEAFVRSLPKTETHLHMEGACPLEMLQEADPVRYREPPKMWADDFRYESFEEFMELYQEFCGAVFHSAEQYHRAARTVLGNCFEQNAKYVETSFHTAIFDVADVSGPEIVRAIKDAAPVGLEVRVFMGMSHNAQEGNGIRILREFHEWEDLDGIDLHGPEYWPVEDWTAGVWERARAAGKLTKAHAGEFRGADFVSRMLDQLNVSRIEHGVRAVEDPAVVDRLVRERIPLDVCPISNVKLAVKGITSMSTHPIRKLFDAGVFVTLSSDDPLMFGNSLSEEYYALYQDLHFSKRELIKIARNGFEIAIWDDRAKERHLDELDRIDAAVG